MKTKILVSSLAAAAMALGMISFAASPVSAAVGDKFASGGLNYKVTAVDEVEVGDNHSVSGDIVIPGSVSDGTQTYTVTSISSKDNIAFAGAQITSIRIPSSVKVIGYQAFKGCGELKTVIFDDIDHSQLETIGDSYAFASCNSLSEITLPAKLDYIGAHTFYQCVDYFTKANLKTITFKGGMPRLNGTPDNATDNYVYTFLTDPNPDHLLNSNNTDLKGNGIPDFSLLDFYPSLAHPHDGSAAAKSWLDYETEYGESYGSGRIVFYVDYDCAGGSYNGNSKFTDDTHHLGDKFDVLVPTTSKPGCDFDGWYTSDGTKYDSSATGLAHDMSLTARWTPTGGQKYTVTFDSQGGTDVDPIKDVENGKKIDEPSPDPTRSGYKFGGWYKDAACTDAWDFDSDTVTGDITLYAKWTRTYTVRFDSQGGTDVASITDVVSGAKIHKPADPTRTDYVFGGWYKDAACTDAMAWDFDNDTVTGDITLHAKWTKSHTVKFDINAGADVTSPTSIPDQLVADGDQAARPTAPERDGYTLSDWFYNGAHYDFSTPVHEDMTLVAQWSTDGGVVYHTVTFNSDGGSAVQPQSVADGGLVSNPGTPAKSGYSFDGWFLGSAQSSYDFNTPVTGDITLTAHWTYVGGGTPPYYPYYPPTGPGSNGSVLFPNTPSTTVPSTGQPGTVTTPEQPPVPGGNNNQAGNNSSVTPTNPEVPQAVITNPPAAPAASTDVKTNPPTEDNSSPYMPLLALGLTAVSIIAAGVIRKRIKATGK